MKRPDSRRNAGGVDVLFGRAIPVIQVMATLLVIAIHYRSSLPAAALSANGFFQEFACNGLARVAVPLFALISGYLFFAGYGGDRAAWFDKLKRRGRTLLIPYLAASLLIFVSLEATERLVGNAEPLSMSRILHDLLLHPRSEQLWYLRDLVFLCLLAPLLSRLLDRVGFWLPLLAGGAWLAEWQFFPLLAGWRLVNVETFFFFTAGAFLASHPDRIRARLVVSRTGILFLFSGWILLAAARVLYAPAFTLWYVDRLDPLALAMQKTAILAGCLSVTAVARFYETSRWVRMLSDFSFFLYLYHLVPLKLALDKLSRPGAARDFNLYWQYPLALALLVIAGMLLRKNIPAFYGFLTGQRGLQRAP